MDLLALIAGSGWASGVNLYAVVALLGIYGRLVPDGPVPASFTSWTVIGIAGALYLAEFVVDKVPYLDNTWDAVHTFVRPAGAAAVAAVLSGDAETSQQVLAAAGAGLLAFLSHSAKASSRAAINTSPEPVSNITVSLFEDGLVAGLVWLAVTNPLIALIATVVLTALTIVLVVVLWRFARRLFRRRPPAEASA